MADAPAREPRHEPAPQRFAQTVAHELRNPLAAVKLALQALERHAQLADNHATRVAIALREVGTMERVLANLVAWARPVEPRPAPVTAGALVERALAAAAPALEHGVLVEHDASSDDVLVVADAALAVAALAELVRNAAEASPAGGRIQLRVRPGKATHAIEVTDEGGGIAPDTLERVFEPFYGTRARGVGLGLSNARAAARGQRGDVRLESGAQGTVARLELPAAESRS